jgi:predicted transcriptional regulator
MKILLAAVLLCLPGLACAQPEDEEVEVKVIVDKEVREDWGPRGKGKKHMREDDEKSERRMMRRGLSDEEHKIVKRSMELQKETRDIARDLRSGDASRKKDLEKLVTELFDSRLKLAEMRLKRTKAEVEGLEKVVAARKEKRAEMIKQRVEQLSGQADEMEW